MAWVVLVITAIFMVIGWYHATMWLYKRFDIWKINRTAARSRAIAQRASMAVARLDDMIRFVDNPDRSIVEDMIGRQVCELITTLSARGVLTIHHPFTVGIAVNAECIVDIRHEDIGSEVTEFLQDMGVRVRERDNHGH